MAFATEKDILVADATIASVQSALTALTCDRGARLSLRTTALRKLEEQAPRRSDVVSLAITLSLTEDRRADDDALRRDAIGVLVRAKTPESRAAIDKLKCTSLEAGVLAERLIRKDAGR